MSGTLYLVATPIGNLEDITLRALRVLREVGLIACEDTRHTRRLLAHYRISRPTISYHEHNEHRRTGELIKKLEAGMNIALVSDAGMPLVSDPGFTLVRSAVDRGVRVVPIPGPSALITGLAASALAIDEFTFAGFLPPKKTARKARLRELAKLRSTLVLFEAPHRIESTLGDALDLMGDRKCVVARELTKLHEEFLRGSLSEVHGRLKNSGVRGELVLIIGPALQEGTRMAQSKPESISLEVEALMEREGLDPKAALKRVARLRGISRSEAYRLMLAERQARER